MNETPTLEKETESVVTETASAVPANGQRNPNYSSKELIKKWIRKTPFFPAMDYFRRKVYDSFLFDGLVRPLAKTLEE